MTTKKIAQKVLKSALGAAQFSMPTDVSDSVPELVDAFLDKAPAAGLVVSTSLEQQIREEELIQYALKFGMYHRNNADSIRRAFIRNKCN